MTDWTETTLSEVADIIPGYAFKGTDFGKCGVPIIKIKDICPPKVDFSNIEYVDIKKYKQKNIKKVRVFENDFVVAMTGATIGKIGKIYSSEEAYINQRVAKIRPKNFVDWDYIYYNINSSEFYQHIQNNIDSHSAQENISTTSIGRYSLQLPNLDEQRAIAAVLSSLDDKIDLLHRQNATLEAMAEALFRQWFVVEAKEEWEYNALSYFGDIVCGKTPSKSNNSYFDGEIPFIKIPDMHGKAFIDDTNDRLSLAGANSQKNKYIPKNSICVSCIATVGLVSITKERCQTNQQINSIVPFSSWYIYYIFFYMRFLKNELVSMASGGTATLNLNTSDFAKIEIITPPKNLLKKFEEVVNHFFNKIIKNQNQINTLEKLRDTLLPKLMSGEVRVDY